MLFASTKFDIMEALLERLKNDCLGILICSGAIEIIVTGPGRPTTGLISYTSSCPTRWKKIIR